MGLFDTTRYGRFLVGATILLSLAACERRHPRTTEEVVAAAKAARLDESPPLKAVPVAPLETEVPAIPPAEISPPVLDVTDRTGPKTLATWQWNKAEWDSLTIDWDKQQPLCSTTHFGRFCLVEGHEPPRLFYQAVAHDSAWTEINLALPDEEPHWGMERGETDLDTINLDGQGTAELMLRFHPASYGSGGGTAWDHVSVLDVSATPKLIFRALLAAEDEAFGGYAIMHGYTIAPGEQYTGCKRSFKVRHRELVLGPVRTIGNTKKGDCTLTQLLAGRYGYHNGKIFFAGR